MTIYILNIPFSENDAAKRCHHNAEYNCNRQRYQTFPAARLHAKHRYPPGNRILAYHKIVNTDLIDSPVYQVVHKTHQVHGNTDGDYHTYNIVFEDNRNRHADEHKRIVECCFREKICQKCI